jgi:pimeloyl-ACP methyl ester carboxylesterase
MPAANRPVYLLHGLLGTAYAHFGEQIRAWAHARVVPVDLLGHGRCPLDAGEHYLDRAYEHVVSIVQRFGPGRLVAASYLGGPIAVRIATQRPELVTSLVLTGYVPDLARPAFLQLLDGFHRLAAERPELAAEYDRLHGTRWKDTLTAYGDDCARRPGLVLPGPGALTGLGTSVHIVNGSHKSAERHAAERAAELGPRITGAVIEGAGHIAGHDAPAAFTAAVQAFWAEADR